MMEVFSNSLQLGDEESWFSQLTRSNFEPVERAGFGERIPDKTFRPKHMSYRFFQDFGQAVSFLFAQLACD